MMSSEWLLFLLALPTFLVGILSFGIWWGLRRRLLRLQKATANQLATCQRMMEASDIAMVLLDDSCYVQAWNSALGRLHGCKLDDIAGQQFFMRFAPAGEAAALTARAMSMRTSDAWFSLNYTVVDKEENPRTLQWQAHFFTDDADGRRYLALTGSDVSALETALSEVSLGEARMRLLFDSVPVPLVLVSPEGEVRMANPACADFWGYESIEELVGQSLPQHIHIDDRNACANSFNALLSHEKQSCKLEVRYLRSNGDTRWGQGSGVLVEMAPGQLFVFIQIRDIHQQKMAELALRENEKQLSRILSNLAGTVYHYTLPEIDIERHHDNKFTFVSEGVKAITGIADKQFMSPASLQTIGQLLIEKDRPRITKAVVNAAKGDGRFKVSYRLRHESLGIKWVSDQGLVWQQPDGSWTIDGHITDITAEMLAHESEQGYRQLIEDTHTGYLSLTTCGRIVEVNQPYCSIFGIEQPEMVQGRLLEELFPKHQSLIQGFLEVVAREGGVHDAELSYKRPDGNDVYALTNAIAVQEAGRTLIKCLVVDTTRMRKV